MPAADEIIIRDFRRWPSLVAAWPEDRSSGNRRARTTPLPAIPSAWPTSTRHCCTPSSISASFASILAFPATWPGSPNRLRLLSSSSELSRLEFWRRALLDFWRQHHLLVILGHDFGVVHRRRRFGSKVSVAIVP